MKSPDYAECEQFSGRLRQICRGEADLPLEGEHSINAYRKSWGLPPLGASMESQQTDRTPPAIEMPSLLIRGWNFTQAMARWALAGMPRRTQQEIDVRLAICQSCPFLQNNHCAQCGCACVEQNQLINKLALATEKCPIGKWQ